MIIIPSRFRRFVLFLLCVTAMTLPAFAQGPKFSSVPPPKSLPIHQTFSTNDEGWGSIGDSVTVSVAPKAAVDGSPDGALQMSYEIGQGKTAALILPLGVGAGVLNGARSFRFKIRADYATELFFSLQEKNGGRYVATFFAPKDAWQTVELSPSDFILSNGADADKDPDNKLDLGQVQWVGLVDAGTVFSQLGDKSPYDVSQGKHRLYLANFQIAAPPLSDAASTASPDSIDAFVHPQLDWMVFGAERAEVAHSDLFSGQGMTVRYAQSSGNTIEMIRAMPSGKLSGASKISFVASSLQTATLLLLLEDNKANRFSATIVLRADRVNLKALSVPLANFALARSARDQSAKLDLSQIHSLEFIDVTGTLPTGVLQTGAPQNASPPVENTLYIGDLRVGR